MSTSGAEQLEGRTRHGPTGVRRLRDAAFWVISLGLVGLLGAADAAQWGAPAASGANAASAGFYLDVGASASLGFQPTGVVHHNGARTQTGYANDVVAMLARRGVNLSLRQVGCPGETTYSMLHTGDHCYLGDGSQRRAATIFLASHHDEVGLVSIDLGFNDVRACLWKQPPDLACTSAGLAQVRANLPGVISLLKSAAGPRVHFVGLLYADPFLSDVVNPRSSLADAEATRRVIIQLDTELTAIYRAADVAVANVPGAYRIDDTTLTTWGATRVPVNVLYACSWTWMCTPAPFGPDDHPNNDGYRAIANTIVAAASGWF